MDTNRILEALETLSLTNLRQIRAKADELIKTIEAYQQPEQTYGTYRQEYTRCNKITCRTCTNGPGHGPYWYAYYYDEKGKLKKKYIGKTLQGNPGRSTP